MTKLEAFDLLKIFGKIASLISFLPLILSIYKWKHFKEKPFLWLFLYFLSGVILNWFTSLFVDLATKYWTIIGPTLERWRIDDTFFIDPIYFLRNGILLGLFCYETIKDKLYSRAILVFSIIFIAFNILNTIFGEGYEEYQTIGNTADNLFKVAISIIILRLIFISNNQRKLIQIPHLWFALGFLVIGSCAGLIDFLSNQMLEQDSVIFYQAHIVKDCFIVIAFLSFSYGIIYIPWKNKF